MGFAPKIGSRYPSTRPSELSCTLAATATAAARQPRRKEPGQCFRMNPLFWNEVDYKVQKANQSNLVMVLRLHPSVTDECGRDADHCRGSAVLRRSRHGADARQLRHLLARLRPQAGVPQRTTSTRSALGSERSTSGNRKVRERSIHLITNHPAGNASKRITTYFHTKPWLDLRAVPERHAPQQRPIRPPGRTMSCSSDSINELWP